MNYFSEIKGQHKAIEYLQKVIAANELNHAYLFIGPPGIGKMKTAVVFAYTIISLSDKEAGIYLKQMIHPDIKLIEKHEGKSKISREQIITDIEQWLAVKPYRAKHRIVIVRDAHLMTLEAANALLKTLEEPPDYAIIILIADDNNILETIISRCSLITFSPALSSRVKQFLLERGHDEKKAHRISFLAQGSIANAVMLAEEENFEDLWEKAVNILQKIYTGGVEKIIETAEILGDNSGLLITTIETILRDILVYEETKQAQSLYFLESLDLVKEFKEINYGKLKEAIIDINSVKKYYNSNLNTFILNINICYKISDAIKTS